MGFGPADLGSEHELFLFISGAGLHGGLFTVIGLPLVHGLGKQAEHRLHGADRVVVRRNGDIDHVGIAVGIENGDHGYAELVGFPDGDLLVERVDHDHGARNFVELADAVKVLFDTLELPLERSLGLLVVHFYLAR